MAKIENPKTYTGHDLETIFFRPMLSGPSAADLGIKIMYNMPVPTTLQFWKRAGDILQKYGASGWNGGDAATKYQKSIALSKVKAEVGYSADDYFNMVYEQITNRADINMGDLSGTELEIAETALFKEAIAESIRATMWLGDTARAATLNTFDGFVKRLVADMGTAADDIKCTLIKEAVATSDDAEAAEQVLKKVWDNASNVLKEFKAQGSLVYLVTSDIYAKYEEELDNVVLESAYLAKQNGREGISYRGIPVIDLQVSGYLSQFGEMPQSFAILTDRRNLALAVNTSDFPGTEVRMWYNPDQMENRQRAVFMAGCDYLLPELVSMAVGLTASLAEGTISATGGALAIRISGSSIVSSVSAQALTAANAVTGTKATFTLTNGLYRGTVSGTSVAKVKFTVTCTNGETVDITI